LVQTPAEGDSTAISELAGVALLRHGGFVAGDYTDNSVHVFDEAGRQIRVFGRKGEGPGEFSSLTRIRASGDSVLIWDRSQLRLTVYDAKGSFGRTDRVEFKSAYTAPSLEGRWPDGSLLFVEGSSISSSQPIGIVRDSVAAIRVDSVTGGDRLLGRWPGTERMAVTSAQIVAEIDMMPYTRTTTIRSAHDGFWVGTADEPRIDRYDQHGRLVRSIRWGAPSIAIPQSELAAWRQKGMESFKNERSPFAVPFMTAYERATFPPERPPYRTFAVDPNDGLWVQRVPRWDEDSLPEVWDVFEDGRWLGAVTLPRRTTVRAVGIDRVLLEWSDDDGVASARVHRIVK
jgi:hypothetical protein